MREIVFLDGEEELRLPVTPEAFEISDGIKIETVNITNIGDVIFGGNSTIEGFSLSGFFPDSDYDFARRDREPYDYVNWFIYRAWNRRVMRFIVTGTPINIAVMLENISYGEHDGTGDVYYTLSVRRYKQMYVPNDAAETTALNPEASRSDDVSAKDETVEDYVIKPGDCLWKIAVKKYGDSALWPKIQQYNKKTTTLLIDGEKILLPPKAVLEAL